MRRYLNRFFNFLLTGIISLVLLMGCGSGGGGKGGPTDPSSTSEPIKQSAITDNTGQTSFKTSQGQFVIFETKDNDTQQPLSDISITLSETQNKTLLAYIEDPSGKYIPTYFIGSMPDQIQTQAIKTQKTMASSLGEEIAVPIFKLVLKIGGASWKIYDRGETLKRIHLIMEKGFYEITNGIEPGYHGCPTIEEAAKLIFYIEDMQDTKGGFISLVVPFGDIAYKFIKKKFGSDIQTETESLLNMAMDYGWISSRDIKEKIGMKIYKPLGFGQYIIQPSKADPKFCMNPNNHEPKINFLWTGPIKKPVFTNKEITLTCDASDIDGDQLTYIWKTTAGKFIEPISGPKAKWTTSEEGYYRITCSVFDGKWGFDTRQLEINAIKEDVPLKIATTSLPFGTTNASYIATLSANGGTPPYMWSISSGLLPDGLRITKTTDSFDSTIAITGTPTITGIYNFTVKISDNSIPHQVVTEPIFFIVSKPNVTPSPQNEGTLKWKYPAGGSAVALDFNGVIYVHGYDDYLYAINPNGELKWKYYLTEEGFPSAPTVGSDGTIYVGSGFTLFALKPDGILKWKYFAGGIFDYSSPVIGSDGTVYIGSYGSLHAINPDGNRKWTYGTYEDDLDFRNTPAIGSDGTIYIGDKGSYLSQGLYAINPDGSLKWKYRTYDIAIVGAPAIGSDGVIYVGSTSLFITNYLYAIGPDGKRKWSFSVNNVCGSPAIDVNGTIYVGSSYYFNALNPDGTLKWRYNIESIGPPSTPAIGRDGIIYTGTYYGLYAFNPVGTLKWTYTAGSTEPAIGSDGTVYLSGASVYAINSTSQGLAISSWSKYKNDNQNAGRKTISARMEIHPFVSDIFPPLTPTNLIANVVSSTQISLTWTESSDDVDVLGYYIYRDGVQIGSSITTSYADTKLSPSTQYCYTVSAYDAAGNESIQSNEKCATTLTVVTTWPKTFGEASDDSGYSVQQTSDGGYIIAGDTDIFGAGLSDVYLIKTDANGNSVWEKTFGASDNDYGYSVQQTSDGGYIIAGYTESYGAGGRDVYLIKTDADGNKLWEKAFGGRYNDYGHSVQQTSDGGYIVTGVYGYSSSDHDVYLIKTDANGNILWEKAFGNASDDKGRSVQQTSDGGYIVVGVKDATFDFNNSRSDFDLLISGGDVYLVKTDTNGNILWEKTYGTWSGAEVGLSVGLTFDGGYIISGWKISTFSSGDVYLIKIDAKGNISWEKTFGGTDRDYGDSVQQTSDGGYIIAGLTESYGTGGGDVYLIKTDGNGNKEWEKTFGGTSDERGLSVRQTSDGGYIIAGYTMSYGAGGIDVYLIKTDSSGNEQMQLQ